MQVFNLSIVLPTYNNPDSGMQIEELWADLQGYSGLQFEIIVVDDASDRPASQINKRGISYIKLTENRGPAYARNKGASLAIYPYIVFIDSGVRLSHNWVNLVQHDIGKHRNTSDRQVVAFCGNLLYKQSHRISRMAQAIIKHHSIVDNFVAWTSSAFLICSKDAFLVVGGFDESFKRPGGEDEDFCFRLITHDYKIAIIPDIQVYHEEINIKGLLKRAYNYGLGYGQLRTKYPSKKVSTGFIGRVIISSILILYGVALFHSGLFWVWKLILLIVFVYAGAFLFAYRFYLHKRTQLKITFLAPLIISSWDILFFIGHLSYCFRIRDIKGIFYTIQKPTYSKR